jgi:hypothetical protein
VEDLDSQAWYRGSRCSTGACVEVKEGSDTVSVRDSKQPGGGNLLISRPVWMAFINALRAGELGCH